MKIIPQITDVSFGGEYEHEWERERESKWLCVCVCARLQWCECVCVRVLLRGSSGHSTTKDNCLDSIFVRVCGDVIGTREWNTQKLGAVGGLGGGGGPTPPKSEVRFEPRCEDQLLLASDHLSPESLQPSTDRSVRCRYFYFFREKRI